MLSAHFFRGPAVSKVVGDDLRHAQTRYTFQPSWLGGGFMDMWIGS